MDALDREPMREYNGEEESLTSKEKKKVSPIWRGREV